MGKKDLLIIGRNSFIGSHIMKSGFFRCRSITHEQVHDFREKDFDYVINTAIHPQYISNKYSRQRDFDVMGCQIAEAAGARYIMLSTRKVYGSCKSLKIYTETSATNPADFYSENKLMSEGYVRNIAGDTAVIFRGSNIFGEEIYRQSFMGFCLTQLITQHRIVYDIDPHIIRDFLSINDACALIKLTVNKALCGVYNLSYGQGIKIGLIAERLLRGFGCGDFLLDSTSPSDQFVLSNDKLLNALSINREFFSDPLAVIEDIALNIAVKAHAKTRAQAPLIMAHQP